MFECVPILLGAFLAGAPGQAPEVAACGVELRIRTESSIVAAEGGSLNFYRLLDAAVVNTSATTVTLVQPGDGSGVGWRTPTLHWQIVADTGYTPPESIRCGNINSLRVGEVFDLPPGAARRLNEWIPPILGVKPGTYTLRLSYVNDPLLKWQGLEIGPHDASEMQRVRASTPCRAVSNEITLIVVPKKPSRHVAVLNGFVCGRNVHLSRSQASARAGLDTRGVGDESPVRARRART